MIHTVEPMDLQRAKVMATDKTSLVIDDFLHGWQDWYLLEAGNPHHREYSTRKLTDPKWQGQTGQRLALEVQAEKTNELAIVLTKNFFRFYRGKLQEFVAVVKLIGGTDSQIVSLAPGDFKTIDGKTLSSWKNVDLLSLRAYYDKGDKSLSSKVGRAVRRSFGNCGGKAMTAELAHRIVHWKGTYYAILAKGKGTFVYQSETEKFLNALQIQ